MTAEDHAAQAKAAWPDATMDCLTAEDVGRCLVRRYRTGPPAWTGMVILRSLGIAPDEDPAGVH